MASAIEDWGHVVAPNATGTQQEETIVAGAVVSKELYELLTCSLDQFLKRMQKRYTDWNEFMAHVERKALR